MASLADARRYLAEPPEPSHVTRFREEGTSPCTVEEASELARAGGTAVDGSDCESYSMVTGWQSVHGGDDEPSKRTAEPPLESAVRPLRVPRPRQAAQSAQDRRVGNWFQCLKVLRPLRIIRQSPELLEQDPGRLGMSTTRSNISSIVPQARKHFERLHRLGATRPKGPKGSFVCTCQDAIYRVHRGARSSCCSDVEKTSGALVHLTKCAATERGAAEDVAKRFGNYRIAREVLHLCEDALAERLRETREGASERLLTVLHESAGEPDGEEPERDTAEPTRSRHEAPQLAFGDLCCRLS